MRYLKACNFGFLSLIASGASSAVELCGKLGNVTFKVLQEYMFFPMEPVGGIWGGAKLGSDPTDCKRVIQAVTLEYHYPSLQPASGNVFSNPEKTHVEAQIVVRKSKAPATLISEVDRYTKDMRKAGPVIEIALGEFVGLDGADTVYGKGSVKYYWKRSGELVTDTIMCDYYPNNPRAADQCNLSFFQEELPASISIIFSATLIDKVYDIKKSSLEVVQKFIYTDS